MPEGEWVCTWRGQDATVFHRRVSGLTYRLADQQLLEKDWGALVFQQLLLSTLFISLVLLFGPMDAVSGVNMLSQLVDVSLAGPGGAGLPAAPFTKTSVSSSPTPSTNNQRCENGALMDSFGIFLQGLLAVVAFSTLMCEYGQGSAACQISDSSCWCNPTSIQSRHSVSLMPHWSQLRGSYPTLSQKMLTTVR